MGPSEKIVWKIYMGVLGAVTTIAAQKLVAKGWELATGEEPPSANDPETPLRVAVSWALASGVGIGVTQLLTNRMAASHWQKAMGHNAPKLNNVKLKI